jgi:endonuclease III
VVGVRQADRVTRLRRCAELAIAGAPWRAFPGIGAPGVERIELFTGTRAVLALEANALRVLIRLGYGDARRSYWASYRQAQSAASAELPASVPAMQRATQLLRRHGQTTCRWTSPACATCAIVSHCPSAGRATTLY